MSIRLVAGIEGARNCADVVEKHLGMDVEVADGRKAALAILRHREFAAVVVDETIAECDSMGADTIWERSGLAIPLQVNFALSGAARLIREIRAALRRREREQMLARHAAVAAIESELKSTVAGLLLQSELAPSGSDAGSPLAERLRVVVTWWETCAASWARRQRPGAVSRFDSTLKSRGVLILDASRLGRSSRFELRPFFRHARKLSQPRGIPSHL